MDDRRRVDLHAHTTASDGTLSPSELVRLACTSGLAGVAVTDHDTMDGVQEALVEGTACGVEVVPGVEISLEYKGPMVGKRGAWMHLLVYHLSPDGPLGTELADMQRWRAERNVRMIRKLAELGLPMTLDEVAAVSGGGQLGRPHFAQVMLDKGYVATRQEAFDRFLAKGGPAYEEKQRLEPDDAIARARAEGAVPVLAHPYSLGLEGDALRERLARWTDLGLCGLEVEYTEHTPAFRASLTGLAGELGLLATGGSDFHGANKTDILLGSGRDHNVRVPWAALEGIRALASR